MPTKPLSSLLYQAIQRNDIAFITSLLSFKCNLKILLFYKDINNLNASPLHHAAAHGQTEALHALLAAGTQQDCLREMLLAEKTHGLTPLHCAAEKGQIETLNALLSHEKSAPFIKEMLQSENTQGLTPLSIAQYQHQHHPSDTTQHILQILSRLEATFPKQVSPKIKQEQEAEAILTLAHAYAYGSNNPAASSKLQPSLDTPVCTIR